MKKIILLISLFVFSLGYSQALLQGFESGGVNGGPFGGMPAPVIEAGTGSNTSQVLKIVTNTGGEPWQGINLFLSPSTDLTVNKTLTMDVLSDDEITFLVKVTTGGAIAAAPVTHNGDGTWQTLSFTFNTALDGQAANPSGIYSGFVIHAYWINDGGTSFFPGGNPIPRPPRTFYVDNIREPAPPPGTITWIGGASTDWNTASNWSGGVVPTASESPIISSSPSPSFYPTAAGPVAFSNLTIDSGASFIANSTVTGSITYERDLSTSNWYYISSPVAGQNVNAFVAGLSLETQATFSSFCTFDTAINNWVCYENTSTFVGNFVNGKGYIVNLSAPSGTLSFTGTMNVSDVTITLDTTGSGYNLLGNPYTSFVNTASILTASTASLETQTLYVFDAATNSYVVYVTADDFRLAPGQAFFIQSSGVPGNVAINEAFQSHEDPDTFSRSANRTEVYLTLSDGVNIKNCRLYYIDGTTTGFDNGYDGPMFRAFADPFSIYTRLVTGGNGTDMGVQSLPNDNYENLIVPVGITAAAGTEFSISANAINLPDGINLYLEDRQANTFTVLNANSDFTLTTTNGLNGVGRFYLHTSSSTLGLNDNALVNDLQIYTSNATKELIIKGQLSGATSAEFYNIEGKLLLSKALDQFSDSNVLDISGLSSGVYVVKVNNASYTKTQKVIIK